MSSKKTDDSPNIVGEYIKITREYQEKYGINTVLLMQVGAFFEVYGLKNAQTGMIDETPITEFANICGLNISDKKVVFDKKTVVMAGFRDYTLDKYLQKLCESGWTSIVYTQEKTGTSIKRVLHSIHSAGTYISYDTDSSPQITNHIMCLWIDTYTSYKSTGSMMIYGVSIVNIFTGKSVIFEYSTANTINSTTFDELERCVSIYCPSEVILVTSLNNTDIDKLIQYTGLQNALLRRVSKESEKSVKCSQQKYMRHIIGQYYDQDAYDVCDEFQRYTVATQSFCYLLDFIQEHNPHLVRKITIPEFNNTSDQIILANHTLKQLNIIDDSSNDSKKRGQLSSVLALLNKCGSAMGRRLFKMHLVSPTFNETWLNQQYGLITKMLTMPELVELVRRRMSNIRDIEKINRQLVSRKLYPASIYYLYETVSIIHQIHTCLAESADIVDYLYDNVDGCAESSFAKMNQSCISFFEFIDGQLYVNRCQTVQSTSTFDETIIKPGVSEALDTSIAQYDKYLGDFNMIRGFFNKLMQDQDTSTNEIDYIKIHETDKSGLSLQMTKKRAVILKTILSKYKMPLEITPEIIVSVNDIKFTTASTSANDDIDFPQLNNISKSILKYKEKINTHIAAAFSEFQEKLESEWYHSIAHIANYIAKLDVLVCKAYIARQYHYCCPEIEESTHAMTIKSFVDARNLRHPLIEHLQQNEIYVPNDITIGGGNSNANDGMLLYGTNAVGKTSFIRALGISVIMAQAGMFVPCSQFRFKPYTAIFSRILGNDNIFKGLSTFAVEMSELRVIMKMADQNSLILGDELCSGTETESALSIFVAGLSYLHDKRASFVFATHFHEIIHYDEIRELNRLCLAHMAVHYDREIDGLVYDRKLREGAGNRMYGLEVCKSLHLPEEFMNHAYAIRGKYFPENLGGLADEPCVYNAKKVRGICEMCKEQMGEETHHLQQQKNADSDGFIGTFHKNHSANLMSVCQKCHDQLHATVETPTIRKKTTRGKYVLDK